MIRCVIWLAAAGLACGSERRSEAAHAGIPDRAPPSTSTVDPDSTELRFTSVSAGEEFTCGLAQEGRAYCWGSNEVGQLGDGSKMGELVNRPYAAPVAGGHAFAAISAGDVHVCALTADGQAFCWGYDVNGALGGPGKRSAVPSAVVTDLRFVAVVAGPQRTCGLTRDGVVYCWGRFSLPSAAPGGRPALEPTRLPGEIQFRAVGLGLSHACGLARDSRVYCWGSNEFGELGVRPTCPRRPAQVRPPISATVLRPGRAVPSLCPLQVDSGSVTFRWAVDTAAVSRRTEGSIAGAGTTTGSSGTALASRQRSPRASCSGSKGRPCGPRPEARHMNPRSTAWIAAVGLAVCAGRSVAQGTPSTELSPELRAACDTMVAVFRRLGAAAVERSEGQTRNPLTRADEPGCRIEARGDVRVLPQPQLPENVLVTSLGWPQDPRYAADGDFGANTAVAHRHVLCFVDSRWNGETDGGVPDLPRSWYRIKVRCLLDTRGTPPRHAPSVTPRDTGPGQRTPVQ